MKKSWSNYPSEQSGVLRTINFQQSFINTHNRNNNKLFLAPDMLVIDTSFLFDWSLLQTYNWKTEILQLSFDAFPD